MATVLTLDASVFVSGYNTFEIAHAESHQFLQRVQRLNLPLVEPVLLLPELSAAVARVYQDDALAMAFVHQVQTLPHLSLIPLGRALADLAAQIAAEHRLRGSDAVYVAVTRRYNSKLVTLDAEQRQRARQLVPALTPQEALSEDWLHDERQ